MLSSSLGTKVWSLNLWLCFCFVRSPFVWFFSIGHIVISSVQSLSRVWLCNPMNRCTPGLPVHHQLPESTQTHVRCVGDAIQPSHPLSSPSPPAPNPSQHLRIPTFQMKWPKYWSFSFSISPSNEHPGLISFRIDWLDLLAVQGTLKSLLQHHSSKASIFQRSAFSQSNCHIHTWPLEKP